MVLWGIGLCGYGLFTASIDYLQLLWIICQIYPYFPAPIGMRLAISQDPANTPHLTILYSVPTIFHYYYNKILAYILLISTIFTYSIFFLQLFAKTEGGIAPFPLQVAPHH